MLLIALLLAALDAASAYKIDAQPSKAKRGSPATAHVEVVPVEGAHVSPDAPISFNVKSGTLLKMDKAKLGRADARETAKKGVAFDVPFTAASAGSEDLKGTLNFFICTDTLCEKQSKEIVLPVTVE
jgi:hypothetical protein